MSFISMALKDVKEAEVVPEGEYDLRVNSAEEVASKNTAKGGTNIKCVILVESAEFPRAMPITHFMSLPNDKDEEKTVEFKMLQIKRFLKCFSIPFDDNGFDVDDFAGSQARSLVVQEEMTKEDGKGGRIGTGVMTNVIRLPRLADEVEEEKPRGRAAAGARRR